jgi:hypothetical protein
MSDLTLTVACDYCGAQPGEPCRTSSGAEASSNHGARNAVSAAFFREGFELGYEQGYTDRDGEDQSARTGSTDAE